MEVGPTPDSCVPREGAMSYVIFEDSAFLDWRRACFGQRYGAHVIFAIIFPVLQMDRSGLMQDRRSAVLW